MDNIYEELKNIFQNFRWIDNIPEDQYRRDEICFTNAIPGKKIPRPPCHGKALCEDGSRRRATLAATLTA